MADVAGAANFAGDPAQAAMPAIAARTRAGFSGAGLLGEVTLPYPLGEIVQSLSYTRPGGTLVSGVSGEVVGTARYYDKILWRVAIPFDSDSSGVFDIATICPLTLEGWA